MFKQYIVVFLKIFFDILSFAIIIRILLSWTNISRSHPVYYFINEITAPVLNVAAKITPKTGMIDLSPVIALLGLDLLKILILAFIG